MHDLDTERLFPRLTGAVLACSVPPSGNRYIHTAQFKIISS